MHHLRLESKVLLQLLTSQRSLLSLAEVFRTLGGGITENFKDVCTTNTISSELQ